jgi:hypothetical protein
MKTTIKQLSSASLLTIVIVLSSFAPAKGILSPMALEWLTALTLASTQLNKKMALLQALFNMVTRSILLMVPPGLVNLLSFSQMTGMQSWLVIMEKDLLLIG